MIERSIYTALTTGIAWLAAKPRRVYTLFKRLGLSDTEAAGVQTWFTAHVPNVIHSYPRIGETKFPAICIVLGDESESTKFLDDSGGIINAEDAETLGSLGLVGAEITTSISSFEYHLLVIANEPDMTIYLYQIVRNILMQQRAFLKSDAGLLDQAMSGADLVPDPRYMPDHLFVRRLTLKCLAETPFIGEAPSSGLVRSVDGIFVDDGRQADETGGVLTQVTAVVDQEENES